jgi:HD-like signal output (HDOD) protein/CheY-like chemotaxis protein
MTMRVLFVDDELNILQAMRRSLHDMREQWTMEFVPSGAAALQSLAGVPADVVVSDMRMPGMDGWQLLAEVKRLYPQTVRLVLSGHADPSSVMRAVGTAQLYLAKPCESAALKAAITQTQMLRQLLSSERLALLVGRVGMLPCAPKAFQEILTCLQNPAASLADAAKIIGRDVAMTANIMKLVNSAFFGSRRPITTTERAVAYLGMDTLGALVLGHSVFQGDSATGIAGFSPERLWQHSFETGAAARAIAFSENLSIAKADEAFLAGVLHDVGKIVFSANAASLSSQAGAVDMEAQMAAHHSEVGAYLLGLWGFPNSIVCAVAFHHMPGMAPEQCMSLARIVHVADRLVHLRSEDQSESDHTGVHGELFEDPQLRHCLPKWSAAVSSLYEQKAVA